MTLSIDQLLRHTLTQLGVLSSQLRLMLSEDGKGVSAENDTLKTLLTESQPILPSEPPDSDAQSPTAYWAHHAKCAVTPFVFDHCFFNANPAWGELSFVTRIRTDLGCPATVAAPALYDALLTYQVTFTTLVKDSTLSRQSAHADALVAAQQCLELLTATIDT